MQTDKASAVKEIREKIRGAFGALVEIRSAYLYGSVLTDKWRESSDIDVLFVVDEPEDRGIFLEKIKTLRDSIHGYKLDVNILFPDELQRRWHIYRPPTYFIWVKRQSVLLWGTDTLHKIQEKEITEESIYKRAVDLAQSSRAVYINDKNPEFWETKYVRWLRELACGVLYLEGTLELDLKVCGDKLSERLPDLKMFELLRKDRLPIKTISEIAETVVVFIQKKFM